MTLTLFIVVLTFGAAATSLLTEAVKKLFDNSGLKYSPNVIALLNAIIIGCVGTAIFYQFMGIPYTTNNIICLLLMAVCVWIGSMIGYDKVIQLIKQLGGINKVD